MRTAIAKFLLTVAAVFGLATSAFAQQTVTQTTLSGAVNISTNTVVVASATNIAAGALLFVDQEVLSVSSISGTTVQVNRGTNATAAAAHNSGAIVYVNAVAGTGGLVNGPFVQNDPLAGNCTFTNEAWNLRINVRNARIWACSNGQWMNAIDSFVFYGPTWCQGSVSGNSTGTNGYTSLGTAPSIPVVQDSTSATGTNTHYYMCTINPPSRSNVVKSAYIVDVQFYYGTQTTALGTQVAVLASGTMNSKIVFTSIGYPAPAASETATGLAEAARVDTGTLVITPVVGSFNTGTTTAGEFFSASFIPSVPIAIATDRQQVQLTVSLLNTATSATVTNSPGFIVHYRSLVAGY